MRGLHEGWMRLRTSESDARRKMNADESEQSDNEADFFNNPSFRLIAHVQKTFSALFALVLVSFYTSFAECGNSEFVVSRLSLSQSGKH